MSDGHDNLSGGTTETYVNLPKIGKTNTLENCLAWCQTKLQNGACEYKNST